MYTLHIRTVPLLTSTNQNLCTFPIRNSSDGDSNISVVDSVPSQSIYSINDDKEDDEEDDEQTALNDDKNDDEDEVSVPWEYGECLLRLTDIHRLKVGDKIDHRDDEGMRQRLYCHSIRAFECIISDDSSFGAVSGRFLPAVITQIGNEGALLSVHYIGYDVEYDVFVDRNRPTEILNNFALFQSISTRPTVEYDDLELDIGDSVCVKVGNEWQCHKIAKMDNKRNEGESDQFAIFVKDWTNRKRRKSMWFHPDDTESVKLLSPTEPSKKRKYDDDFEYQMYSGAKRRRMNSEISSNTKGIKYESDDGLERLNKMFRAQRAMNVDHCAVRPVPLRRNRSCNPGIGSIKTDVSEWCVDEVVEWFESKGFKREMDAMKRQFYYQCIDGAAFLQLESKDLLEFGFNAFMDRKAILKQRDTEFPRR